MTEHHELFYSLPTDIYTSRIPTPPRILVPPPAMNDPSMHDLQASRPVFLPADSFHETPFVIQETVDWQYHHRREAQMILPYLYLGPTTITKDPKWFEETGITMALGVRSRLAKITDVALARVRDMGVEAQYVDVQDETQLIRAFPVAFRAIRDHLLRAHQQGEFAKVLVFCESGNDRSASIVAAYAMEAHSNVDHIRAVQLCQSHRFCTSFDENNKRVLQSYWDIICAQRGVAQQMQQCGQHRQFEVVPSKKRHLTHEADADMTEGDTHEAERFGGRTFAPFMDASMGA